MFDKVNKAESKESSHEEKNADVHHGESPYKGAASPKRKLEREDSKIEEHVVKPKKKSEEGPKGPAQCFLETDHGLEVQTVKEAIKDKVHAEAFTGHADLPMTKEEQECERDDMGLPVNHHSAKVELTVLEHHSSVLSRGASGPVGQQTLGKMHR